MSRIQVEGSAWLFLAGYLLLLPVSWVGAMFLAAAVHELGHCAALYLLEQPVLGIRISAFGARIETFPMEPRKEFWIALAGPAFGLILCLFWRWIPKIACFAFCQSFFNLIPIWPMDGGRVLQSIVSGRTG